MTGDAGVAAAAVILAGGRGSRLGGVRKADLVVGGRRLLDVVLDACAGCAPVVVVGEADLVVPPGVLRTREDPPFSGPASGLAAGLAAARTAAEGSGTMPGWVLCLGCDQPGAPGVVPALIEAAVTAPPEVDAISARASTVPAEPIDLSPHVTAPAAVIPAPFELREMMCEEGTEPPEVSSGGGGGGAQIEWMLSIIRRDALARVVADHGPTGPVDCSMRRLLGPLRWACTPVAAGTTGDIDTWDDHARWQQRVVPG